MARGFEREDAENQDRLSSADLCEGYACLEPATVHVGDKGFCAVHAQGRPDAPTSQES